MKPLNFSNVDVPLSRYHGYPEQYNNSQIGKLLQKSENKVFIREIPDSQRSAELGWRVVWAEYAKENSTMTYFYAVDQYGLAVPHCCIGVHFPSTESRIPLAVLRHKPEFGDAYHIARGNRFMCNEPGGYSACVLDLDHPSEHLDFGLLKGGRFQHQSLNVYFRLFPLGEGYPNDAQSIRG